MKREEYESMSDMEAWEADDSIFGGICVVIFILLLILCVTMTLVNDCRAAEIVYYDDSCVVVERVCVDSGQGPMIIGPGCEFDGRSECMIYGFWNSEACVEFDTTLFYRVYCSKTVTYVRKEAEPTIVANLDSMIAGSCIRIPHDAPIYYFVDTVREWYMKQSRDSIYGWYSEGKCDTLYDTTFVYEVE